MNLHDRTRRLLLVSFAALTISGVSLPAQAEAPYPNRPVRIVVPFAAGGVADSTSRIVAEKLSEKLGQRFYVENQPGAGGIAAARTALGATADG
jgi:tripartite-type tricarboxylate transporter receptor subunit TctC